MSDDTDLLPIRDTQIGLSYLREFLASHRRARTEYPGSYADQHLLATGHRLAFGCCAPATPASDDLCRE